MGEKAGTISHNICIASYPRSGNTFLRHILWDVYGIFSWNNHDRYCYIRDCVNSEWVRPHDSFRINGRSYEPEVLHSMLQSRVIKTHDLPERMKPFLRTRPFVISLIRDGRDAVVSEAHHRSDIIQPGSPYLKNLEEAITAKRGSHFGGWSENVKAWLRKADLVIHFEQLITEPERITLLLAARLGLPEPDLSKLPTFESQRAGKGAFTTNEKEIEYRDEFTKLFFRRGETGVWRDEMPGNLQQLFLKLHGKTLQHLGYHQPHQHLKYWL
jgi:hypothetical protein